MTGGGRRVGAAISRHLHDAGASLAIHCLRSAPAAEDLVREFNACRAGSAASFSADLLDLAALPELIKRVIAVFGRLDALVNNASSFYPTPIGAIDATAWDDLIGTNFRAPLFLTQAAAPHLARQQGSVVNITDIHAERPLAGYPVYSAAKGALLALTRALAVELAPDVRVNAVAPGPILWPEDTLFNATERESIIGHTLLRRAGDPDDIARAVAYLLTAGYVTGQVLNVDGGRSAHL